LSGKSVDEFNVEARKWLEAARDPRWKSPYTELIHQPMLEVLRYLRDNGNKTYIVTGGGQDFVRVYSERVYGIPPEQIVGTAGGPKNGSDKSGKPFLIKEPKLLLNDKQRRQARPPDDRNTTGDRVRQFDRRPADARIHQSRRRRPAGVDRAARRCNARVCLWSCARAA